MVIVKYFDSSELECKHCGKEVEYTIEQMKFLVAVSRLRNKVGRLTVTSYYRCQLHPLSIERPTSAHLQGLAIDITSNRMTPLELFWIAKMFDEFTGFGISAERNFLHLDAKGNRRAIWSYKNGKAITMLKI